MIRPHNIKWTPKTIKEEIRRRRAENVSCFELALDYDLSVSLVARMTRDLGVKCKPGRDRESERLRAIELNAKGIPRGIIVARLGVSYSFLRAHLGPQYIRGLNRAAQCSRDSS